MRHKGVFPYAALGLVAVKFPTWRAAYVNELTMMLEEGSASESNGGTDGEGKSKSRSGNESGSESGSEGKRASESVKLHVVDQFFDLDLFGLMVAPPRRARAPGQP